jgi:hypothetical protein
MTPSLLILYYIDSCAKERSFAHALASRSATESPISKHSASLFWLLQADFGSPMSVGDGSKISPKGTPG